jgi:hypothetical protein
MLKLVYASICALLLMQVQTKALAADSSCYEIVQTHHSFGRVGICFDANSLRMDLIGSQISIFADAPDWKVHVFNLGTKKQSSKAFAEWCKTSLETYAPWTEVKTPEGKNLQKTSITFDGFKALKLTCSDSIDTVDEKNDGISWSMKRKSVRAIVGYVFLDGIAVDSHIAKIVAAIYCLSWKDRLPLEYYRDYGGRTLLRWSLNTNRIQKIRFDRNGFNKPTGFRIVPMREVTQSKFEYFN